ncbi:MAG: hypothetical protein COA67_06775 [Lutibacter sp.]|nr:MAG: hypothetical protein COA67_06775 [Lutibacter sp.]
MNTFKDRISKLKESVKGFAKLERILAVICIFIPLILLIFDSWTLRESISKYADMNNNHIYVFLLSIAGMMFVVNGTINNKKWYNIVLGISLMGVALFHWKDFEWTHIIFAGIFFLGSAIVISYYTSKKQYWIACTIAIIIVLSLLAHFWLHWISLFAAEWIALGIIGIQYLLESYGVLD